MNSENAMDSRPCRQATVYLLAFGSLFAGFLIYVMFRPAPVLFFNWLDFFGISGILESIRNHSLPLYAVIPQWVVFSLPNGFWAFSYSLIITHTWWEEKSLTGFFWLATVPVLGISYELLQYVEQIPGVFCVRDLLFCFFGMLFGFCLGVLTQS